MLYCICIREKQVASSGIRCFGCFNQAFSNVNTPEKQAKYKQESIPFGLYCSQRGLRLHLYLFFCPPAAATTDMTGNMKNIKKVNFPFA